MNLDKKKLKKRGFFAAIIAAILAVIGLGHDPKPKF